MILFKKSVYRVRVSVGPWVNSLICQKKKNGVLHSSKLELVIVTILESKYVSILMLTNKLVK